MTGSTTPAQQRTSPVTASCDGPVLYDGYSYQTVQIGTQCWFKENLRNDNYRDGTPIPGNLTMGEWSSTSAGAQAVFGEGVSNVMFGNGDEVANLANYGRLYNWYAVSNPSPLLAPVISATFSIFFCDKVHGYIYICQGYNQIVRYILFRK